MDASKDSLPNVRSWRDIPQEVKPRAMSKTGRRRYSMDIVRVACGVLFIAGAAWGTVELVSAFENDPRSIAKTVQSAPLARLALNTDGVLNRDWVLRTLALPKGITLMEVDLDALQSRLLASGQVSVAVIVKSFPDTLSVTLTERAPVARVRMQEAGSEPRDLFVSRDGVVFSGECLDQALVDELPWLVEGVRLVRTKGGGILPIPGMEIVSDLLTKARYEGGQLYPLLRYISLSRLFTDGEIEARSPECEGLVFSTREDFFRQLAYLDFIRDDLKPTPEKPLARIELSHGPAVPVTLPRPQAAGAPHAGQQAPRLAQQAPREAQQPAQPLFGRTQQSAANNAPSADARRRQAPTRPAPTLPTFQNLQRNSTQREL